MGAIFSIKDLLGRRKITRPGMTTAISVPEFAELVTFTLVEYEALALRLAERPGELQAIRARLGKNRLELPLFDTPQFARDIEAAFEWMLQDRTQP